MAKGSLVSHCELVFKSIHTLALLMVPSMRTPRTSVLVCSGVKEVSSLLPPQAAGQTHLNPVQFVV